VPEVPAPNAYDIQHESALDNYKRGAFLEKADRFSKDKIDAAQGMVFVFPIVTTLKDLYRKS
jgi:hypothetical protein